MIKFKLLIITFFSFLLLTNSCGIYRPVDAKKYPPNPELRVKKNLEEGRGFRIMDMVDDAKGTNYEFASSNELWRASLDAIDFMPLVSVNYSGGLIVSDWYSGNQNSNENIKISIRFLTNEIRSDALDIKIFNRQCSENLLNCNISEISGNLVVELQREILKRATEYKKNKNDKKEKKD